MRKFVRRLTAVVVVAAPLAIVTIATPGVSQAQCEVGYSWDSINGGCKPPPPPPDWWKARPAYAPAWAPQSVPSPPPTPAWVPTDMKPVWDPARHAWGLWFGGVWLQL